MCKVHLARQNREAQGFADPTDAERLDIIEAVKVGADLATAAQAAGVAYEDLERWMEHNSAHLADLITQEVAKLEVDFLRAISTAAKRDWRAATYMLDRTPALTIGRPVQQAPRGGAVEGGFQDDQVGPDGEAL